MEHDGTSPVSLYRFDPALFLFLIAPVTPLLAQTPGVQWLAGADSLAVRPGPNPFNPETTLRFQLPTAAPVSLTIHNMTGQRVVELVRGQVLEAGLHERVWSGTDQAGRPVASGLYLYRLVAGGQRLGGVVGAVTGVGAEATVPGDAAEAVLAEGPGADRHGVPRRE